METILVTGGAGFIGRYVCENLLREGHEVRIIDSLVEQVHGAEAVTLPDGCELVVGDLRDTNQLAAALSRVDSVVHLAADVGVGQSMYETIRYTSANDVGTAALFQMLIERPVRRVVTASSMSIYGEGLYQSVAGEMIEDATRDTQRCWDPLDAGGSPLVPMPTPEWKRPALQSIYALNKYVQERTTHIMGQAYGIESVCLRLFNVYGAGQALSNPYTGVLANFASRLLHDQPPMIFEDGRQRRDFVHVRDVAHAFVAALFADGVSGATLNIGSGTDRSIGDIAVLLASAMGRSIEPDILGKARAGDIRHCFCDTAEAHRRLGFSAKEDFSDGLAEAADWVARQSAGDHGPKARRELEKLGLVA